MIISLRLTRRTLLKLLVFAAVCLSLALDLADHHSAKWLVVLSIGLTGLYYLLETNYLRQFKWSPSLFLIISLFIYYINLPNNWNYLFHLYTISFALIFLLDFLKFGARLSFLTFPVLTIILISGEGYYRYNSPIESGKWGEFPALQIDKDCLYSLKPNSTTHLKYNNYDYVLKTNSLGFHDDEIEDLSQKDSNCFRIFIVGDAFSMPEGMVYQNAYPYLLEKELQKRYLHKKIEVINGGVTGYCPNEFLMQIKKYISILKPDLIVNQFFINEFDEINSVAENRLYNIGFNRYTKWEEFMGNSQLRLNLEKNVKDLFKVPNYNFLYIKSLIPYYESESTFYSDTVINKVDAYLKQVVRLTNEHNCEFLLLYVPGQIEVSEPKYIDHYPYHLQLTDSNQYNFEKPNRIISELCRKNGIKIIDSESRLKSHKNQPVYFPASWHWNKEGHKVISVLLTENIELNQ